MINANWLLLIIPGCFILLVFLCAIFTPEKEADEAITKAVTITKAKEEIIETFLNHADCEHDVDRGSAHYPGHHDITYDIDRVGEAKIRKILEGM